jgi:starch-binding outer membrane protein, SusD/RagB family
MRSSLPLMRIHRLFVALLFGAAVAGCSELDPTNPNAPNSAAFWKTADDANRGLTATYNALLQLGVFSRWHAFANDIRSDIGTARTSPWGDLANFNAFTLSDYNFEVNREIWVHNYVLIKRANLVIANVPGIDMNAGDRDRIVAEAKFLRALSYYNLVTLYENIPLITSPPEPTDRIAESPPAETWAQIEKDLVEAAAVLPEVGATPSGRATKGAALAMLGRVRLQMAGVLDLTAKWGEAATVLGTVVSSNKYSLLPNYADNFLQARDNNNPESLFEVETEDQYPIGVTGISFPKMIGPCYRPGSPRGAGVPPEYNPTFCDGRPTRWYFDTFMTSRTTTGLVDPRLDATILYSRADRATEQVYGKDRASYFIDNPLSAVREDTMIFFRKYGETQLATEQRWDNPVNYKVIRYADVLLMQAEALNESNQTTLAFTPLNQVRLRAGKSALAGLSQAALRDTILYERMFELGLESSRFNDLRRQDRLNATLGTHDLDFVANTQAGIAGFVVGKSERLPIPTTERNLNPTLKQNPGW